MPLVNAAGAPLLPAVFWCKTAHKPAQIGVAALVPPMPGESFAACTKHKPGLGSAIAETSGVSRAPSAAPGPTPVWYAGLSNDSDGAPPPSTHGVSFVATVMVPGVVPTLEPPTENAYGLDAGQPAEMILLLAPSWQPSVAASPAAK